jgi:hypothetical protein
MIENFNSTAAWQQKFRTGPVRRFVVHRKGTAPGRPKPRHTSAAYSRLEQEFISNAINAQPSIVAPACPEPRRASCRRFSVQNLRSTFPGNFRPAQRSTSPIRIATPKRLKFAVSSTKQTSRHVSNRYKITGYREPRFEFSSVAPVCRACPELRRESRRAACRRIPAPLSSRKIAVKMQVLRRSGGTFLTGTPKQLEFTVINRKQTPARISNRDTNSGAGATRLYRFSAANCLRAGHSLTRLDDDASVPRQPNARNTNP